MKIRKQFKPLKLKESIPIHEDQINEFEDRKYTIKRVKGQLRAYKELEKWEEFEEEIRKFLKILGFKDVNDRPIEIGGHNVDVIGGCDDILLVFECKTRNQVTGTAKQELEKFNGWKNDIKRGIHKKFKLYKRIHFIFSADFTMEPSAKRFAKNNKIKIWDQNYIREYEDLYLILGDSTKYHILYELGYRPQLTENYFVPALRVRMRGRTIYNFFIEPEMLLKISYVFRRTSSQRERAYQRPLKSSRLENIRAFLEQEDSIFLNNIIINFKERPTFQPVPAKIRGVNGYKELQGWLDFGILKIPNYYCSAEIIDGQHRTYGFTKAELAKRELKLPVVALDNASEIDRATFFIKINKEQRPVDTNLLWDLAGEIEPQSKTGIISNAVKALNKKAPFKNVIYVPSFNDPDKPINIGNFCKGIEDRELIKIFKNSADLTVVMVRYFTIISNLFSYDWQLKKKGFMCANPGVNVMLRILKRILLIHKEKVPARARLTKYLKPISLHYRKFYFKKNGKPNDKKLSDLRKRCSSEAGRGDVEKEFWDVLEKRRPKGLII